MGVSFQIFNLGNIFENVDQKVSKQWFFFFGRGAKNHIFKTFFGKIFKNIA